MELLELHGSGTEAIYSMHTVMQPAISLSYTCVCTCTYITETYMQHRHFHMHACMHACTHTHTQTRLTGQQVIQRRVNKQICFKHLAKGKHWLCWPLVRPPETLTSPRIRRGICIHSHCGHQYSLDLRGTHCQHSDTRSSSGTGSSHKCSRHSLQLRVPREGRTLWHCSH